MLGCKSIDSPTDVNTKLLLDRESFLEDAGSTEDWWKN